MTMTKTAHQRDGRGRGLAPRVMRCFTFVVNGVVGVVFFFAVFRKAASPQETLDSLAYATAWSGLSPSWLTAMIYVLVGFEIIIASLLVTSVLAGRARVIAGAMLLVFTIWLLVLASSGAAIQCGCGLGETWLLPGDGRTEAIIRNVLLLGLITAEACARPRGACRSVNPAVHEIVV
ncbi:MAG: hypothetical protein D6692_00880 [Planctomycetota bacterium]|nr:MAG: hypothetical protein D6692_00880 [Planctomycetota bacterium]